MKGKSPEDVVNKEFTIECQLVQEESKQLGLELITIPNIKKRGYI